MKHHLKDGPVILRKLRDSDIAPMAKLANNKNIWNNVRDFFPYPYTEKHAEEFIKASAKEKESFTFAIIYYEEFAGVISLIPLYDVYRKSSEIGYWLGEPFWNKGIATKAVSLATEYGLSTLGFHRIHAGIFEYNKASIKVLEKCGYKKEGVFIKSVFKNDRLWDEYRYAIIR